MALVAPNLDFYVDIDPAFYSDADPDLLFTLLRIRDPAY
jgi:hypothetical protein